MLQTVEIKIELGHTASIKEKADPNDKFTHDWEVFVRGAEGNSIQHFVKMVVFYLHQNLYSKKKGEQIVLPDEHNINPCPARLTILNFYQPEVVPHYATHNFKWEKITHICLI